jgi:hypothetical protein
MENVSVLEMVKKATEEGINRIDSEIQIQTETRKTSAAELRKIKESICNEISSKLSPFFNLPEDWVLDFDEKSLKITEKETPGSWGSGNVYYHQSWGEEGKTEYTKIEINFSSASGNDLPTLKRVMMQGKVAEVVLNHSEDMLIILNEIHNKYFLDHKKWRSIYYDTEREITKLDEVKRGVEMNLLMGQLKTTGIEFISVKDSWDNIRWPEFEVKQRYSISNIVSCKVVNITPSGKMMDVEFTAFRTGWDSEAKNYFQITQRVSTEKVESFLKEYKDQIRHSDES